MIRDAVSIAPGTTLTADVVVVGSGAAGVPLALELAASGKQVCMLEGGGEAFAHEVQSLYAGTVADPAMHSPTDTYRQRRLGGSTAIWGGRCMPFDPIDFEPRPWVPYSGWPIDYGDLEPWYALANDYLEAGAFAYRDRTAFEPERPPLIEGFASQRLLTDGLERFSRPTDVFARYRARLREEARIDLVSGANCTGIRLRPDGRRVDRLDVATLDGRRFTVRAGAVVLAVGGLETARLLLASDDIAREGIGNAHDVVGRFYMCHIAGNVGELTLAPPLSRVRHGYEISPEGIYCRRRIALTPEMQRRLQVNNGVLRLHFPRIVDPAHRNGVLSGLFLARRLISYEYAKRLNDGASSGVGLYARHLWNVLSDPLDTAGFLAHWLRKRTLAARKFPSVILRNRTNRFSLEVHGEQAPRPDSRVTIGPTRDALGVRRIHVDWRHSPEDIESVRRTLHVLKEDLAACGVGSLRFDEATLARELLRFGAYGGHHVGTARMGSDPRTSVVDRDCRVHSVDNLFIAGSAVFTTSSQANPTLTITALALRLAAHLGADAAGTERRSARDRADGGTLREPVDATGGRVGSHATVQ